MPIFAIFLIVMWIAESLSVGLPAVALIAFKYQSFGMWCFLLLHFFVAAVGLLSDILLFRGNFRWKWFVIGSCGKLLIITDFQWFSLFAKAGSVGGAMNFFWAQPKIGFGVIVMPLFSALVLMFVIAQVLKSRVDVHI